MIPTKKISLTLIEYAEPLIDHLEGSYSQSDLESALKLATCVWNSCVLDQWRNTTKNVDALRRQMSNDENALPAAVVEMLIVRKQQLFGNDPRGITNQCVIFKNGELVVRAEARLDVEHIAVKAGPAN